MTTSLSFRLTKRQEELLALLGTDKREFLVYGGARSGKTLSLCYAIVTRALMAPGSHHLIARHRFNAAMRSIGKQTIPEVMRIAYPGIKYRTNHTDGITQIETPYGGTSEVWLGGLDSKERMDKILGTQFATIYLNEATEILYDAVLTVKSRLAESVLDRRTNRALRQKFIVDLNPTTRAHWTARLWLDCVEPETRQILTASQRKRMALFTMNPLDNAENLDPAYIQTLKELPERARKRMFEGVYQSDIEGALWSRGDIQRLGVTPTNLKRVVVSVDPALKSTAGSDETGLIVCAIDDQKRGIVLEDASGKYSPEGWARRAYDLYEQYAADCVVYETNQGGDMVKALLEHVNSNVPTRGVRATRGKYTRAEPIAALYSRGRVYHCGVFSDLEDQMCFPAGVMVSTSLGPKPIESVRVGDLVKTRFGLFPVEVSCRTGRSSRFVRLELSDGGVLECTPNHPIYEAESGRFVPARSVRVGHRLLVDRSSASTAGRSLGGGAGGTACRTATTVMREAYCFTERFTRRMSARFRRDTTSIMSTGILGTTLFRTCRAFLQASTRLSTIGPSTSGALIARRTHERLGRSAFGTRSYALFAAGRTKRPILEGRSIAVRSVGVVERRKQSVYNLRVACHPEYFADGVLVHNCSFMQDHDEKLMGYSPDRVDALVWGFTELFQDMIVSRRPQRKYSLPDAMDPNWDPLQDGVF